MELKEAKTVPISFRVTREVYAILQRRASKQDKNVNAYSKQLVSKDAVRKR